MPCRIRGLVIWLWSKKCTFKCPIQAYAQIVLAGCILTENQRNSALVEGNTRSRLRINANTSNMVSSNGDWLIWGTFTSKFKQIGDFETLRDGSVCISVKELYFYMWKCYEHIENSCILFVCRCRKRKHYFAVLDLSLRTHQPIVLNTIPEAGLLEIGVFS